MSVCIRTVTSLNFFLMCFGVLQRLSYMRMDVDFLHPTARTENTQKWNPIPGSTSVINVPVRSSKL